jgi:hypothetical protein
LEIGAMTVVRLSLGGEQDKLANGDHASDVVGGLVLDVTNLVGEAEVLAVNHRHCLPALNGFAAHSLFSL